MIVKKLNFTMDDYKKILCEGFEIDSIDDEKELDDYNDYEEYDTEDSEEEEEEDFDLEDYDEYDTEDSDEYDWERLGDTEVDFELNENSFETMPMPDYTNYFNAINEE